MSQPEPRAPASTGTPGHVVCVVDDDVSVLRSLGRVLRAAGFIVETFESGESFLARRAPPPHCLVLDVNLRTLTGFDVHERLRASGTSVPTIFITGHDDAATRERVQRAGTASYLLKPFGPQALISAIENAL